jgi:hypothetical protein
MELATTTLEAQHPAAVPRREPVLTTAELAECNCPEACERDHERD